MKLNHLNLTVTDVAASSGFLQKYFGLKPMPWGDGKISFLTDDNGMVIAVFPGQDASYPASFHIGFIQDTELTVNEINQRLRDDGFDIKAPMRFHGSWTFYVKAPGGFMVEVMC